MPETSAVFPEPGFLPPLPAGPNAGQRHLRGVRAGGDTGWLGPSTLIPPGCAGCSVSRTSAEPGVDPFWVSSGSCLLQAAPSTSSLTAMPWDICWFVCTAAEERHSQKGGFSMTEVMCTASRGGPHFPLQRASSAHPCPPGSPHNARLYKGNSVQLPVLRGLWEGPQGLGETETGEAGAGSGALSLGGRCLPRGNEPPLTKHFVLQVI